MKYSVTYFYFLIFFLVIFYSCRPKTPLVFSEKMLSEIPDTILPVDTMINILTDIQLAEALLQEAKQDSVRKLRLNELKQHYSEIAAIHNITQQDLQRSYTYYVEHPLLMNYIYQKMIEKLNLLESKYKTQNETK